MATTNHGEQITAVRKWGGWDLSSHAFEFELAADLLEMHDREAISLDNWTSARLFVEKSVAWATGKPFSITNNGV